MSALKGIKIVATAVIILLLLTLLLYLATPWLMSWQLKRLASGFDCQSVITEVGRPGWRQLDIGKLQLQHCSQGVELITIEQLHISYSLLDILQLQRLGTIKVSHVEVEYRHAPQNSEKQTNSLPTLPSQILSQLPLLSLQIDRLTFRLLTPKGRLSANGQLDISQQDTKGTLTLDWLPKDATSLTPTPLLLGFDINAQDSFSSYLGHDDKLIYQLGGKINIKNQAVMLKLEDKFDTAPALAWLRSWFDLGLSERLQLKGNLQNSWNIRIPTSTLQGGTEVPTISQSATLQIIQAKNISPLIENLTGVTRLQIDWQQDTAQWQLSPQTSINIHFTPGTMPLPDLGNNWQLTSKSLQGKANWSDTWQADSQQGALQLTSNTKDKIRLTAKLNNVHLSPGAMSAQLNASLPAQDMQWQTAFFSGLSAEISTLLAVQEQNISINIRQFSRVLADQLQLNSLQVQSPKLVFREPLSVTTVLEQQSWQSSAMAVNIATGPAQLLDQVNASAVSGQLRLQGNTQLGQQLLGQFDAELHNLRTGQTDWGSVSLQSPLQLNFPNLSLQPDVRWPSGKKNPLQLRGKLDYQLLDRRGMAEILMLEMPLSRLATISSLQPLLQQQEIKLAAGQLNLKGRLPFNLRNDQLSWTADLSAKMKGAKGQWGKWGMQQAEGSFEGQINATQVTRANLSLNVPKLSGFTSLTDLTLKGHYEPPAKLQLDLAEVKLLGGKVTLQPFDFDLGQQRGKTMMELSNMQLAELLRLQTNQDIQATGALSGQLPLHVREGEIYVDNGFVSSIGSGGTLIYKPTNGAQLSTNPGMKIALKALSNFHYDRIKLDVNYQPDGELLMDTQLKGSNPDWQNGQPIDFNIRIEQNLLKLIQALTFSDNLSKGLDRQIRQRIQP